MTIEEIRDNFALLDDWDDRYRYLIELGRMLDPMPEAEHSAANKVQGCVSQVWLSRQLLRSDDDAALLKVRDGTVTIDASDVRQAEFVALAENVRESLTADAEQISVATPMSCATSCPASP
jgi:hypothetical protein